MKIESYRFGRITIDGNVYQNDVKLIPGKALSEWWRSSGHLVRLEDVKDLLQSHPDFCVFGTGAYGGMKISPEAKSALEDQGTEVIIEKTEPACQRFNRLSDEGRNVVGAFHLTC